MKLLNIFHHVLDEIVPVAPPPPTKLGNLPTTAANTLSSPIKRRKSDADRGKLVSPGRLVETPEKSGKGETAAATKANAMGYFANAPHYMKIYELLKSAYTNYKVGAVGEKDLVLRAGYIRK